jgi:hypothetical protein
MPRWPPSRLGTSAAARRAGRGTETRYNPRSTLLDGAGRGRHGGQRRPVAVASGTAGGGLARVPANRARSNGRPVPAPAPRRRAPRLGVYAGGRAGRCGWGRRRGRTHRPSHRVWGCILPSAIWSTCAAPCRRDARLPPAPRRVRSRSRQRSCRTGGREPLAPPATRRPDAPHSEAAAAAPVRQGLLGAGPAALAALEPPPGHRAAGDRYPLAPAGLEALLALGVPPAARTAAAERRGARADRRDGAGQPVVGQRAGPGRAAEGGHYRQHALDPAASTARPGRRARPGARSAPAMRGPAGRRSCSPFRRWPSARGTGSCASRTGAASCCTST